jgi:sugar lactone lactonase YvrE
MATGIKKVAGLFSGTSLNESYTLFERLDLAQSNTSFSVASRDNAPKGIIFNNNGTKLYVVGRQNESVYEYNLSTAYDISSSSNSSTLDLPVSSGEDIDDPTDLIFNDDGTELYVLNDAGEQRIHRWNLSTAYDISTAVYDSIVLDVTSQDAIPQGLEFNNNGTKLYVVGKTNERVYQYTLSTAYDISTAVYDSVFLTVGGETAQPNGIRFNNDGSKLYVVDGGSDRVYQYGLNIAYDISTASYDSVSVSVAAEDGIPEGLAFNNDGTKMYIAGDSSDAIYEYTTTTQAVESEVLYTAPSDKCAKITADLYSSSVSGTEVYIGGVLKVTDFDKVQFQEPYQTVGTGRIKFYQTDVTVPESDKLDYFFLGPNETFEIRAPIGVTTVSYELRIIEDNAG